MGERHLSTIALAIALLAGAAQTLATVGGGPDWGMIGNDSTNSRNQPLEHDISPATVHGLAQKWVATTKGDVSATPAVVNGAVYFGDFGGMLWKLDSKTGDVIWSHSVSDYTGIVGDLSRTSPSIAGNTLIVGSLMRPIMLGIDAKTGELRWKTQVHPDTQAAGHGIMTGSPVLAGDTIYTGVSASGAGGPSATFRGAIVALNAQTGRLLWRTYSLPGNGGLPGGYESPSLDRVHRICLVADDRLILRQWAEAHALRLVEANDRRLFHGSDSPLQEIGDERPGEIGVVRLEAVAVGMAEAVVGVGEVMPLDGLAIGEEALPQRSLDGRRGDEVLAATEDERRARERLREIERVARAV